MLTDMFSSIFWMSLVECTVLAYVASSLYSFSTHRGSVVGVGYVAARNKDYSKNKKPSLFEKLRTRAETPVPTLQEDEEEDSASEEESSYPREPTRPVPTLREENYEEVDYAGVDYEDDLDEDLTSDEEDFDDDDNDGYDPEVDFIMRQMLTAQTYVEETPKVSFVPSATTEPIIADDNLDDPEVQFMMRWM